MLMAILQGQFFTHYPFLDAEGNIFAPPSSSIEAPVLPGLAQVFEVLCSWTAQIVLLVFSEYHELERMRCFTRLGRQTPHVIQSSMGWSSAWDPVWGLADRPAESIWPPKLSDI